MPRGSLFQRSTNWNSPSNADDTIPWQSEVLLTPGDPSWWDVGTPERIEMPAYTDATRFEIFFWGESGTTPLSNTAYYLGPRAGVAALPRLSSINFYRLTDNDAFVARGYRSGLRKFSDFSAGAGVEFAFRAFQSGVFSFTAGRTCAGVLVDPVPIAVAATRGDLSANSQAYSTTMSTLIPANAATVFDPDGIIDLATGKFVAPAGAVAYVATMNTYCTATNSSDHRRRLLLNSTEIARYEDDGALRGPGPGCFGLRACSPGDEIEFQAQVQSSASGNVDFMLSVEFY